MMNCAVLLALIHAFDREQAEFTWFLYVYCFGFGIGSGLLYWVLRPSLGLWSLAPIMVFEAYLLARFCLNSLKSALWVTLLYHVFQVGYIVVVRMIKAHYS